MSAKRFKADLCNHEWTDGWGEHTCHVLKGHTTDHRCKCDATISAWMVEHGEEFTDEEARLRLRQELLEQQEGDSIPMWACTCGLSLCAKPNMVIECCLKAGYAN